MTECPNIVELRVSIALDKKTSKSKADRFRGAFSNCCFETAKHGRSFSVSEHLFEKGTLRLRAENEPGPGGSCLLGARDYDMDDYVG